MSSIQVILIKTHGLLDMYSICFFFSIFSINTFLDNNYNEPTLLKFTPIQAKTTDFATSFALLLNEMRETVGSSFSGNLLL
jgi:hypothetical protein